jgi:molybdopterin-guanine dinucleotide biosynthesis protein A
LNIRENSRNSRPVSPSSEKLSPYITIYHHRNLMNSTRKANSGDRRRAKAFLRAPIPRPARVPAEIRPQWVAIY